ncbi:MAG: AAA family ATPase [Oscillospiraceae bacterium]|nr:AAA family ATPase [Oscillospiraceae bacterium]
MIKLNTIDADTLMSTPLPVTRFIVEGLLPEGLHILAGSPKIGKS